MGIVSGGQAYTLVIAQQWRRTDAVYTGELP